jgi:hypothetical protein
MFVNVGAAWQWRRVDRKRGIELERSDEVFETLDACMSDAELHGYLPPAQSERNPNGTPRP